MKKFQGNVSRELKRAYPDRRRLEWQCITAIAFVRSEPELLECPSWVMIINIVAMDMLKSKLPPGVSPLLPLSSISFARVSFLYPLFLIVEPFLAFEYYCHYFYCFLKCAVMDDGNDDCDNAVRRGGDPRTRPRLPLPEEDPYSVAGSGSAGSGGSSGDSSGKEGFRRSDRPPKLPPRDSPKPPYSIPKVIYTRSP